MAGTFKPVGIDADSLFPTRVETRLANTFASKSSAIVITPGASAAANTTAINAALAAHGRVRLGPGQFDHNGIVFPADGQVILEGSGPGTTILNNVHATNDSVSIEGVGSGANPTEPYANGWTLRDLTVTAPSIRTGQVGIDIVLANMFSVENVQVRHHDRNVRINSAWEGVFSHVTSFDAGAAAWHTVAGFAGSTPLTFIDCHALGATVGALFEGDINAVSWTGGDFVANGDGIRILSSVARLFTFTGLNFEGQTGTDIVVGSSTLAPGAVNVIGARFQRTTTTGTRAIDFQAGGPLTVTGSYFTNYTTGIRQTNITGLLSWESLTSTSVATMVNANGTVVNAYSGRTTPTQRLQVNPSGIIQNGALKVGDGTAEGVNIWSALGYGPWDALGNNGDFFIQGAASGPAVLHSKASGTWSALGADPQAVALHITPTSANVLPTTDIVVPWPTPAIAQGGLSLANSNTEIVTTKAGVFEVSLYAEGAESVAGYRDFQLQIAYLEAPTTWSTIAQVAGFNSSGNTFEKASMPGYLIGLRVGDKLRWRSNGSGNFTPTSQRTWLTVTRRGAI